MMVMVMMSVLMKDGVEDEGDDGDRGERQRWYSEESIDDRHNR